ncbi:fructosamine kinase family protein [Thalassorhabdus alkalitolerans]|uniref:Fructosamine kinase family protein n=1 Tax=Thalassorhabdus alkalitolerans TaxID=2282697 RepID=A0ABW0YRS6_9BACI|nr:fructosamine kinase family protein [Thalassobacillus sp. C254]
MKTSVELALSSINAEDHIKTVQPVSGGSISSAYYVETTSERFFVKLHEEAPKDFFSQEAAGLQFLEETHTLAVPEVLGWGKKFIVMEWVEGEATNTTEEMLGTRLAQLHSHHGTYFGLEADNFIGELPQSNGWEKTWGDFLREKRLKPQFDLARSLGRLSGQRGSKSQKLLEKVDELVPPDRKPSRLHGDLWGGNWIAGPGGEPFLIDPAVFYGDYEFEIAFMDLFGGFSPRVYGAYQESKELEPDFEDRKPLYQLYYLLVHLNIFGESYGRSVDKILNKYV